MVTRRIPALAAIDRLCPDGVTWVRADRIMHPEAIRLMSIPAAGRFPTLPFVWAVGRIKVGDKMKTVDERRVVIERLGAGHPNLELLLHAYAVYVVNHPVDGPAPRLKGKLLAEWLATPSAHDAYLLSGETDCDCGGCRVEVAA